MTNSSGSTSFAAPTTSKMRELGGLREVPRLAANAPALVGLPRGSATVIAIPGYSTNDLATLPLRSALRALGHHTAGWGFGVNRAEVEDLLASVTAMVAAQVTATGKAANLIGWSNGGVFAREVARDRPDLVERVFTYGTPIFGGPKFTRGATMYPPEEVERISAVVDLRNEIPITRPITAFHSRRDHIVDWRACIDDFSPDCENIEVRSTHASMGIDPDIWKLIALRLAQSEPGSKVGGSSTP